MRGAAPANACLTAGRARNQTSCRGLGIGIKAAANCACPPGGQMSETFDEGAGTWPRGSGPLAPPAPGRPWGVWASLAWYVLVFEVWVRAYDAAERYSGLQELLSRSYPLHALDITVAWGGQLVIIVLAVRMRRLPVRDYLGWIRPRVL